MKCDFQVPHGQHVDTLSYLTASFFDVSFHPKMPPPIFFREKMMITHCKVTLLVFLLFAFGG